MARATDDFVISVTGLKNGFGDTLVHDGLDLEVRRGEILGVVGGSGTGKSVLMRSIIGLQTPIEGDITVFGEPTIGREETEATEIRKRWGVLFQGGALFSTLTVAENVEVPLREFYPELPASLLAEIASYKVVMTGLPADAAPKFPSELSGGMRKRAGLARALALDPELLFLDEPTAGLDPIGAAAFDELTQSLQKTLGLTVFLITHDLDTLYAICDRVAVLADKKVIAVGTIDELLALDHPWIEEYFKGPRGRAAVATQEAHGTRRPGRCRASDRDRGRTDGRRPECGDLCREGSKDALMETRSNHVLVGAVVLILLAALALFTVWIARLGGTAEKEYDIFFRQSVDGLARGSAVVFSGVPSGQVKAISLWKNDPQFVRVRISVNDETPVLQGTTASISGVGFTGVSQISLDGARKGAAAIGCPEVRTPTECPYGVPVIPTKLGGLGAILNSAPQLLERLSTLTERLTGLLTDRNQASIAGILENTNRLTDALADRGPEIAATLAQTRVAIQQAGDAAQQFGVLAQTTNGVLSQDVKPAMANLNKAIVSAQRSADTLNSAVGDARPGLQTFSKTTIPEANRLVHDLRTTAAALSSVAEKVDQQGASSLIGQQKLPDYKGK